jgi:hypothetical protein
MFTTGVHGWLYAAAVCYGATFIFYVCRRQGMSRTTLVAGILLQGLYLLGRGWLGDVFIPNAIVEGPFILPWCLALIAMAQSLTKPRKATSGVLALVVIFTIFSLFYAKGMIPPTPKKISALALLFFVSESMAHALFYAGALHAGFTLAGKDPCDDFSPWLVWGFILYTVAQVTGAIWSFVGWGNTFSWGPRHLGSAAIWTFFAAALHLQFIGSWKRKSAFFVLTGGLLVLFISYGHYLHEMRFPRIGG